MKPEAGHELEEENKSWEGAEIKWAPLIVKAIIASILTAISMYVTYDGWVTGEVDTSNMFIFKCLACALSVFLTLPNLYQVRARDARGSSIRKTGRLSHARVARESDVPSPPATQTTLIFLTFYALAKDQIFDELQMRRAPWKVLLTAVMLVILVPLTLPFLILAVSVFQPVLKCMGIKQICGLEVDDMALVIVGLIDFMQTLVLIPLGLVVVFSSAGPEDVLVNVVAVQIFAALDDDFVNSFANPGAFKIEALETYTIKKVEDEEEDECAEWIEHEGPIVSRPLPVAAKGLLATIFIALGAYVAYASIPDVLANYMLVFPFKCCMTALLVMQVVPQLYGTTNTALTFISVAKGMAQEECSTERSFCGTMLISFTLFFTLPFVLPILLVFGPVLSPVLSYCGIVDYWILLVGLIDVLQTIVLFPLGGIIIFAADCPTDIYIYFVVVLVFATLDDEFVGAFSDPNQQKLDALGTYCTKTKKDTSHAPDPHPDHPARPDTGPKKRFVMRADGGFHPHGSQ